MIEIRYTSQAKKDLKKYLKDKVRLQKLKMVLDYLARGEDIPNKYKPHKLIGQYKGCMECHVENDFLLIWIDEMNNIVEVIRVGSHSEFFK